MGKNGVFIAVGEYCLNDKLTNYIIF